MAIKAPNMAARKLTPQGASDAAVASRTTPVNGVRPRQFVKAVSTVRRRLIVNIEGEEKSGKDHMALTYTDGPVYIHSFDIGLEGVMEKFLPGGMHYVEGRGDIYPMEYVLEVQPGEGSQQEVADCAQKLWAQFVADYHEAVRQSKDNNGLVLVDTGTEVWELKRLAAFGKLTQVMPHHYGPVNAEMRDLIRFAYEGSNAVFLHKRVDEWENYLDSQGKEKGRKTGRKSRKGFSDIPFLVQANVQCYREDVDSGGSNFGALVLDCRQNPDLNNIVIENDFNTLLQMAYPLG